MSEPSAITGLPEPHVAMNAVGMPAMPSSTGEPVLLQDVDQVAVRLDFLKPELAEAEDRIDHLLREHLHRLDVLARVSLETLRSRVVLGARRRGGAPDDDDGRRRVLGQRRGDNARVTASAGARTAITRIRCMDDAPQAEGCRGGEDSRLSGIMKISMTIRDRFGRPLRSLRVSVTDRCNLRCRYCMPEPDYAWLPSETLLTFEEIGTIADAFCRSGRRPRAADRRRAAAAARPPVARPVARGTPGDPRSRADDQRRPARRHGGRPARRRAAPHHRQPRHAAIAIASALTRFDASTRCSRASTPPRRAGFDVAQDRHRRHARRQRSTSWSSSSSSAAASAPKSASSNTWTSAAPRAGRRARSSRAARCSTRLERALRRDHADRRGVVRAGRSLRAARRHRLRHHLVDDRAVLQHLRSQPSDRRRRLADVPLRAAPAPTCAGRCAPARSHDELAPPDRDGLGDRARIAAPKNASAVDRREVLIPVSALKKDAHLEMHTRGG